MARVSVRPLPDGVHSGFSPQRGSNPDLQGPEEGLGLLLIGLAEALPNKASQSFTNCSVGVPDGFTSFMLSFFQCAIEGWGGGSSFQLFSDACYAHS